MKDKPTKLTLVWIHVLIAFRTVKSLNYKVLTNSEKQPGRCSAALWILFALFNILGTNTAHSQQSSESTQVRPGDLNPNPSTDETPILVKSGLITYAIPRNYIEYANLGLPVLRVTYPGFKPLTAETYTCFDRRYYYKVNCTTIELILSVGAGPDGARTVRERRLNNGINFTPPLKPKQGPYGYILYEIGPDDARNQYYRDKNWDISFDCFIQETGQSASGVCNDWVFLPDGNGVKFFFSYNQIKDVEKIESGIRSLMSHFLSK